MNCHSTSWGTDISLKHVPWEPWTQMLQFTPSMHTVIFQALIERYWPHPSTTERSLGAGTRCYLSINPSPAIRLAPACHTESTWMCVYLIVLWLFVTQWTVVCQAHLCQARILDWVAISSSRGSFWPRDQTWISYTAGGFFTTKPSGNPKRLVNIYWMNEWQSDCHNDRERDAIKNILDFKSDSEENSHTKAEKQPHINTDLPSTVKSTMTTIKMWYFLLKFIFHEKKQKQKHKPSLWPGFSKLWPIGQITPVHWIFLYGQQAKKSFYFSMVERTQKSNKQYFITCENYEIQVSVCTSQGFLGRGLADLLMYYLWLHSLQQQSWIAATETVWSAELRTPAGSSQEKFADPGAAAVMVTVCGANHAHRLLRITLQTGMWGWSGGVFSPPRVRDAAAKMNVGCWLWQYPSKVEAQPRAGHAVTVKNQKLSFRSAYPLPPTHVPPKTCIITMIFSSVSACKQIAGWEINTIVWSGIALFLERLDNKYFRLAGHIVSAAIIQHCHVTQKQPGTT